MRGNRQSRDMVFGAAMGAVVLVLGASLVLAFASCAGLPSGLANTAKADLGLPISGATRELPRGSAMGVSWKVIPFGDLAPRGIPQAFSWNALGVDPDDRVYVVFGDGGLRDPKPADCLLYSYDSRSGERRRLGSFRAASEDAGNWREGEAFMKGHTALVYRDGKMWMGSMPFHDAKEPVQDAYRGSHLFAWDSRTGKLRDMSVQEPGGIVQERSGIMVLAPYPLEGGLFGMSIPRGDLLFFDSASGGLERAVPGPAEAVGQQPPRAVAVAPDGRVFFAFGTRDCALLVYDPGIGGIRRTAATTTGGFWNGSALARDGRGAYLSTAWGELFFLDFAQERVESLGHFLPPDEYGRGDRIKELFCLALSDDGRRLYTVPTAITTRKQALYEFDIASGKAVRLIDSKAFGLFGRTFTGSDVRDSEGRIYFAVHFYGKEGYLLQLDTRARG